MPPGASFARSKTTQTVRFAQKPCWRGSKSMSDDKTKRQPQDRQRINVHEDYELRHWSEKFRVSPDELKRAVAKVGQMAEDVERELAKKD
jgi:hypothetical protein